MTHSTAINSIITKETQATNISSFELSGSSKNELAQSKGERKGKFFMKNYRAYSRLGRKVRPTFDKDCVRQYGLSMAVHFERMAEFENTLTPCNLHQRMAFRVIANAQPSWRQHQLRLEKMWRYWSML
ncbi:hypothetical protein [Aliivibrio fischeri]|uniref:hypothetical protein n=1 Tax=Aliivibrio fischeri TaxID=668 RepID=UPI00080E4784|nr:hypothetical protein [Aliivibrio fischeri]OCH38066.1 hypothetical protein A6E02_18075 [Aliivibrio fischeri]OED52761.1 hypothetical protein BEI47_19170 [Aliivibrio fischeri]